MTRFWHGMGWDGMGWDEMGWDGMRWDVVVWEWRGGVIEPRWYDCGVMYMMYNNVLFTFRTHHEEALDRRGRLEEKHNLGTGTGHEPHQVSVGVVHTFGETFGETAVLRAGMLGAGVSGILGNGIGLMQWCLGLELWYEVIYSTSRYPVSLLAKIAAQSAGGNHHSDGHQSV